MSSEAPKAKELVQREADLITAIETVLPEFVRACRGPGAQAVILHQDAFAVDYQDEEYRLIGMAIKYAGISGREVHVIGKNRETVDQHATAQ